MNWNRLAIMLISLTLLGCQDRTGGVLSVGQESPQGATSASPKTFRGRPIADWVAELRRGPVKELTLAGEDALPVWMAAASDPKAASWVRHSLMFQYDDQAWVGSVYLAMLESPHWTMKQSALHRLAGNHAAGRAVAPALMEKICLWQRSDDAEVKRLVGPAIDMLSEMIPAPEGAIELVGELWPSTKQQIIVRLDLMKLLGRAGPEGVSAVIELCLENEDGGTTMGHFVRVMNRPAVIAVIEASGDEDLKRRRVATMILDRIAREKSLAEYHPMLVKPILTRLTDSDTYVRRYALSSIKELAPQPGSEEAIATLADLIADQDSRSRIAAGTALVAFGDAGLLAIRKAAHSENPNARVAACSAFSAFKPLSSDDVGLLLTLAKDPVPHVRRYAVFALGESEVDDPQIVMAIVAATNDPATKDWATRALGNLGSLADEAIPALREQLKSDDLRVRLQAADALWQVSQDVELVLPIAQAIARDDHGVTTGGYGVSYHLVDGKRVERQRHFRDPLSVRAANLLGDIGPAAKPAVGELIELLKHENASVRFASARALGKIGPAAASAVPALQELIRNDSNQQLIDILKSIAPNAKVP